MRVNSEILNDYIDLLKLIFINSPTGAMILDGVGNIEISNIFAEVILRRKHFCGLHISELYEGLSIHNTNLELTRALSYDDLPFEKSLKGEKIVAFKYAIDYGNGDISYVRISTQAIEESDGNIRGVLVLFDDINEQTKLERKVKRQEHRHESIIKAASDYILIVNENGLIEFINRIPEGAVMEDVLNKPVFSFVDPESEKIIRHNLKNAFLTGETQTYTIITPVGADETCCFRSTIRLYDVHNTSIRKAIITSSDITDLKEAEDKIKLKNNQLKQLNNELRQYNYMATHDLKLPIANIQGYLELLNEELEEHSEITANCLFWMEKSITQANDKIADLIELSKAREALDYKYEIIEFAPFLEGILMKFQDKIDEIPSFRLKQKIESENIYYSRHSLSSILENLFSNAIKYKRNDISLEIELKLIFQDNSYVIEFSDNGIGIDEKKVGNRIFNLFERFHEDSEGSGLGLYLIKSIVEQSHGIISYSSNIGEGTTFKIIIPNIQNQTF